MCVKPILISLNPTCEYMMMLVSPPYRHPMKIYHQMRAWSYLPLPKECLSCQTAQTLMRHRILRHLISVYAVCICSLYWIIQPVPQMRILNFRLATPLQVACKKGLDKLCRPRWDCFCANLAVYRFSSACLINSIITGAGILGSIYHMTLKLLWYCIFGVKMLRCCCV